MDVKNTSEDVRLVTTRDMIPVDGQSKVLPFDVAANPDVNNEDAFLLMKLGQGQELKCRMIAKKVPAL